MLRTFLKPLQAASLVVLVAACGGGAKEETTSTNPAPAAAKAPETGSAAAPAAPAAAPATDGAMASYAVQAVTGGGTVSGKVTLTAAAPAPEKIEVNKDQETCGTEKVMETIKASGNNLGNVVVWIEGIAKGKDWPKGEGSIDQKECHYVPHIQALPVGVNLEIVNSDPVLHNIHAYVGEDTLFNIAQPKQGDKAPKKLSKTGPVELKCDVHSWMHAWVFVAGNPYFAVTKDDGTFSLGDVPPGTYKVKAWHESLGQKEADVTVAEKGTATADFAFEPK